ncbi:MAG TPA: RloB family protein [Streptosporangiaceae bacterium]|nr:RloB family protein [Streptosporangiaceae bacterium]
MSPYQRGSDRVGRAVSRPTARRQGNRIFYVASEGERTEIDYLGRLDAAYGPRLNFLIRMPPRSTQHDGLSPSQVVEDAARAADDVDIYEAWGLFDHDGRPDIDQVCASALRQRVRVALSHPSFELWLLLHFQDFSPAAQDGDNGIVMEKLRAAHAAFADYGRRDKRITIRRFEALSEGDRIQRAVNRARRLSSHFSHETPSNRDPSTDVHLLIEDLGIVPGCQ